MKEIRNKLAELIGMVEKKFETVSDETAPDGSWRHRTLANPFDWGDNCSIYRNGNNVKVVFELTDNSIGFDDLPQEEQKQIHDRMAADYSKEVCGMSEKVENVISFIKKEFGTIQMFNTRNLVGDPMVNVYCEDDVQIDHCPYYGYIEIFGLTEEEFEAVNNAVGE